MGMVSALSAVVFQSPSSKTSSFSAYRCLFSMLSLSKNACSWVLWI